MIWDMHYFIIYLVFLVYLVKIIPTYRSTIEGLDSL